MFLIGIALTRTGKRQDKVDKGGTKARLFFFCFRTRWADVRKYNAVAKTTSNRWLPIGIRHIKYMWIMLKLLKSLFPISGQHSDIQKSDTKMLWILLNFYRTILMDEVPSTTVLVTGSIYALWSFRWKLAFASKTTTFGFVCRRFFESKTKTSTFLLFSLLSCRCIASGNPAILHYAV